MTVFDIRAESSEVICVNSHKCIRLVSVRRDSRCKWDKKNCVHRYILIRFAMASSGDDLWILTRHANTKGNEAAERHLYIVHAVDDLRVGSLFLYSPLKDIMQMIWTFDCASACLTMHHFCAAPKESLWQPARHIAARHVTILQFPA